MNTKFLALVLSFCSMVSANDSWSHWRGPHLNGSDFQSKNLPTDLNPKNAKWRFELSGPAPSTPVIFKDQILLTTTEGDAIYLLSLSAEGKEQWKVHLGDGNKDIRQGESNAAAPSPTTDGEHIWSFTGTGNLACFSMSGTKIWNIDIQKTYGKFGMYWGMATSPLFHDGILYLQLLHDNAQSIVALNASSGKEIWNHRRKTKAVMENLHSYTSPIVFKNAKPNQLIIHGSDIITSHDSKTGKELWRAAGIQQKDNYNNYLRFVATPAVIGKNLIVPSAKNGPVFSIDLSTAKGDMTQKRRWTMERDTPDVPSPTGDAQYIYLCRENGIALCLDNKTGKVLYKERAYNYRHRSSPLLADGKLYLAAMDGTITILQAGPSFKVLSQTKMNERISASIIAANNTLYVRTNKALYAYQ